ncbi:MAG TPA: menaquinone biosynthesis protein [Candidatus Binatia bacterium]|nr:menaquinone biosynthesis protein [Candidatus Binatia bacterium]
MDHVRIASVPFVNAEPLTWGFLRGPYQGMFRVSPAAPSAIPDLLRSGKADVGLIPSIEYLALAGVEFLPQICIASKRRVRSVFLASRAPLEDLRSVALDENSRTSAVLLKIVLAHRGLRDVAYTQAAASLPEMLREHDAALLIGDAALAADTTGLHVYDLAAEWFAITGLPFVFALWAVRSGVVLPDGVRAFIESRRIGMAAIPTISVLAGERLRLSPETIESYLRTNIHFYLGSEEQRGLELFFRQAQELGLAPGRRAIRFRDPYDWERVPPPPVPARRHT